MRIADGAVKDTRNGGYLHILSDDLEPASTTPPPKPKPQQTTAPVERRHQVYAALLALLPLSARHADHLMRDRGLSDVAIARNGYATWPTDAGERRRICRELSAKFDLDGIPGFYRKGGEWRMVGRHWAGFLIASRDVRGLISALSIRLDDPIDSKYLWFSSGGALSPQPHFVRPWRASADREAVLTEGILKSDIVGELLDCTVIGLPGTASFNESLGEKLRSELPDADKILIAYDADFRTKPEVRRQLSRLSEVLLNAGLRVNRLTWPLEAGKGLDDLLLKREVVR